MSESGGTSTPAVKDSTPTLQASGTVTTPGAAAVIVTTPALSAGFWEITAHGYYGAVGDVAGNMAITFNGVQLVALPVQGVANGVPVAACVVVQSAGAQTGAVKSIAIGAAGAVYAADVICRKIG